MTRLNVAKIIIFLNNISPLVVPATSLAGHVVHYSSLFNECYLIKIYSDTLHFSFYKRKKYNQLKYFNKDQLFNRIFKYFSSL